MLYINYLSIIIIISNNIDCFIDITLLQDFLEWGYCSKCTVYEYFVSSNKALVLYKLY